MEDELVVTRFKCCSVHMEGCVKQDDLFGTEVVPYGSVYFHCYPVC